MYLVTRTFQDNGIQRVHGELVVGTGYRTLHKLIELRYLKDAGDSVPFRCELCERQFSSEDTLDDHYITCHPDEIEIDDSGKQPEGDKTPEGSQDDNPETGKGVKNDESNHKGKGKSGKNTGNVS